ncbi:hypothetical protein Goarm_020137 [Gossypium armourianum]|uniref:RNase H type-1 domain-containing protein n=1 Tax=Gossypium armourianum TaxID=34283 RepID=A0A7J9IMU2_9ROSI|nr:hypothetical protein [Gossypium armourianum]
MDDLEGSGLTRNAEITTWVPLSGTTIKIYFEGAFDKQGSRAAFGVVARNGEGRVLIAISKLHENVGSAFAAESLACLCAIQTEIEMEIAAYIRNIHLTAEHFRWIHFRHIKKEANRLAHTIATESLRREEQEYLNGMDPGFALQRMEEEWLREPD